jgi:hypothetical protein
LRYFSVHQAAQKYLKALLQEHRMRRLSRRLLLERTLR